MTRSLLPTLTLLVAAAAVRPAMAGQLRPGGRGEAEAVDSRIHIEHNEDTFVTKIRIQTHGGRIAWSDVLRALARARGYDDTALQGLLPDRRFDVTSTKGRLTLTGLNLALAPHIRFGLEQAKDEHSQPRLVIYLDRAALLASRRRLKAYLRHAFERATRGSRKKYGLVLGDRWNRHPADRNLVVFIHGIHSDPHTGEGLFAAICSEGFGGAMFHYPNDQPIADSAKLLAAELARFAADHPKRGVSLVTHSMGGIVARAVIEDPELDPGNVRQLIMIAPPNHGSSLARFGFGLELWEQITDDSRKKTVSRFYASIEDGLSEASVDLRPGSQFLRRLNARMRNPKVRYTIFLGTGALLDESDLALFRKGVAGAGRRNRYVRFFGARVHEWLDDLDEVVRGKGDGAVSVNRGRLEGVKDTVVLNFGHVGVLRTPARGDVRKVHQEVLKRLSGE